MRRLYAAHRWVRRLAHAVWVVGAVWLADVVHDGARFEDWRWPGWWRWLGWPEPFRWFGGIATYWLLCGTAVSCLFLHGRLWRRTLHAAIACFGWGLFMVLASVAGLWIAGVQVLDARSWYVLSGEWYYGGGISWSAAGVVLVLLAVWLGLAPLVVMHSGGFLSVALVLLRRTLRILVFAAMGGGITILVLKFLQSSAVGEPAFAGLLSAWEALVFWCEAQLVVVGLTGVEPEAMALVAAGLVLGVVLMVAMALGGVWLVRLLIGLRTRVDVSAKGGELVLPDGKVVRIEPRSVLRHRWRLEQVEEEAEWLRAGLQRMSWTGAAGEVAADGPAMSVQETGEGFAAMSDEPEDSLFEPPVEVRDEAEGDGDGNGDDANDDGQDADASGKETGEEPSAPAAPVQGQEKPVAQDDEEFDEDDDGMSRSEEENAERVIRANREEDRVEEDVVAGEVRTIVGEFREGEASARQEPVVEPGGAASDEKQAGPEAVNTDETPVEPGLAGSDRADGGTRLASGEGERVAEVPGQEAWCSGGDDVEDLEEAFR